MADQQITCRDCGASFTFTEGEQEFYTSRGLSAPQRCKACRDKRKNDRNGGGGGDRTMYDATCAKCGNQCQVPFKPRPVEEGGRPVLCKACFDAERMSR
jgi:CxxC-x17-CxxC domain-containing protein